MFINIYKIMTGDSVVSTSSESLTSLKNISQVSLITLNHQLERKSEVYFLMFLFLISEGLINVALLEEFGV